MVETANSVLTIVLIVAAPLAVGYGGFSLRTGLGVRMVAGAGAILVWIAIWLLFGIPGALREAHGFGRVVLEAVYFGGAAAALTGGGRKGLATLFSTLYFVNTVARVLLHQ
jgi:hypothetical protein